MPSPSAIKLLEEALVASAMSAVVPRTDEPDTYTVSTSLFIRHFKINWFFSDESNEIDALESMKGPILFLFRKNLSVTNLSTIELVSLIRNYTYRYGKNITPHLCKDTDYTSFIRNIWVSIFDSYSSDKKSLLSHIYEVVRVLLKSHSDVLLRMAILDNYFTTAFLNIPRSMTLNLRAVVAYSGYIHSAGKALYIRNSEKTTEDELATSIQKFLPQDPSRKYCVVPYAEEFFGPYESEHSAESVRNGLDGVRLNLSKHTVGKSALQEVLSTITILTDNQIVVPKGLEEYWKERKSILEIPNMSSECSIWIILDYNLHETDMSGYFSSGTTQYFMVYAQLLINDSQLSLFKERKPSWVAPITLPHTFSAALSNITFEQWSRRLLPDEGRPVILDPFCGMGTTLLDFSRRYQDAIVIGLDKNPLSCLFSFDNLDFFSKSESEIREFRMTYCGSHAEGQAVPYSRDHFLDTIRDNFRNVRKSNVCRPAQGHLNAQEIIEHLSSEILFEVLFYGRPNNEGSDVESLDKLLTVNTFSQQVQNVLNVGFSPTFQNFFMNSLNVRERWLCLLIWRGLVSGRFSVHSPEDLFPVIESELLKFAKEIEQYERLLSQATVKKTEKFELRQSDFSLGLSTNQGFFRDAKSRHHSIELQEMAQQLRSDRLDSGIFVSWVSDSAAAITQFDGLVDVVVTDPPYGINTSSEEDALLQLYADFFRAVVKALKSGGQLVVSLPNFTKNGRRIPFYQTRSAVIQQITAAVENNGRRIIHYGDSVPSRTSLFRPPYYWASTSGVSRAILHFTIL